MDALMVVVILAGGPSFLGQYRHFAWQDKSGPVYDFEMEFTETLIGDYYLAWYRDNRGETGAFPGLAAPSPTNPDSLVAVFVKINQEESGLWVETYTFRGVVEGKRLKGTITTGGFTTEPRLVELERF